MMISAVVSLRSSPTSRSEITGHSVLGNSSPLVRIPAVLINLSLISRRICPGLPVAERELWLAISRLLWAYTFHALPEEPISLEEYDGLSGRTPLPYRLRMVPRLDNLPLILQAADEVRISW